MTDLIALSRDVLDGRTPLAMFERARKGEGQGRSRLHVINEDVAVVHSFGHCVVFRTGEGLVAFDTGVRAAGPGIVKAIREWSDLPFHTIVYTHGHVDHVGGSPAFVADAGHARPRFVAHENVLGRFARYRTTQGYNAAANTRQFGWLPETLLHLAGKTGDATTTLPPFLPEDVAEPDVTYRDRLTLDIGGVTFELHHAKGETDDHTWTWVPKYSTVVSGDLVKWSFPNCGNPQKVQRYPGDWAAALRTMAALEPDLVLPAHGLPFAGRDRIRTVLGTVASVLEDLVEQTVALMNTGAPLDEILAKVQVPPEKLALPYLTPAYDAPEFVVRNIWRLYGGWYDGNPARLQPPRDASLAEEVTRLAGGAHTLSVRARELAASGDLRLASQLAEWASQAAPEDTEIQQTRHDVYAQRRDAEPTVMGTGIYASAAAESAAQLKRLTTGW
ncbi:alkyl sulfatase dimerization domain-containing protein [Amycolatopsis jejuensis]|uniref:alkyl sulfatase dimerization domain-containing protein n=1 Tax=Amycolatopsis jejuensis TaxID=330084 RepID=UPI000525BF43|nr:alkyl sulfatase dimerization domain-containing protein [Amycolatopsis jejuensis]